MVGGLGPARVRGRADRAVAVAGAPGLIGRIVPGDGRWVRGDGGVPRGSVGAAERLLGDEELGGVAGEVGRGVVELDDAAEAREGETPNGAVGARRDDDGDLVAGGVGHRPELVERRANPADRRAILVCLTKKGKKIAGNVHATILRANRELLSGFGAAEEKALRRMLQRLHER